MRAGPWLAAALALGAALMAAPPDPAGQTAPSTQAVPPAQPAKPAEPAAFSAAQLEQLVAPIALYPDSLLTQTLMASTYPLEIVEAARWLKKNPSLKDKALEEALKGMDWDPSVKSMCTFPEVLQKMNENLDWMQDLGDAFLGQQKELLQTVQAMRKKAYDSGNLKTTEQQKVTQSSEQVIIIEPAQPEVVYVPTYSPTVVYAGWSYPTYYYPPMYAPYPPGAGLVTFTAGVAFGAALWGDCDWGHHEVDIDVNHYDNFNRNTSVNAERYANRSGTWEHNAEHRRGVNYQNTQTAQKYGGAAGSKNVTREQARGWAEQRPQGGERPSGGERPGGGERPAGGERPGGGERPTQLPSGGGREPGSRPSGGGERPTQLPSGSADRPSVGGGERQPGAGASAGTRDVQKPSASGASQRPSTSDRAASKPSGGSAYSGSSKPKGDAAASSRGSSSRGTSSYSGSKSSGASRPSSSASRPPSSGSRPSGGGSRPSGGGGGRGGGRR
jgi:hypothetical protein